MRIQNHLKFFIVKKEYYLQTGFLLLVSASILLFLQFFGYLYNSYLADSMDAMGWIYYFFSAAGHGFLFALLPFLLVYLPLISMTRFYKTALFLLFTLYLLLNILAYLNGIVFQLYKFHINGFVIELLFGAHAGQVFVFNSALILKTSGIFLGLLALGLAILFVCRKYHHWVSRRKAILFVSVMLLCIVFSHLVHAYAAVAGKAPIENAALCLPQFYPLTANRLMLKLGVIRQESLQPQAHESHHNSVVDYPLHPLRTNDSIARKNIVFLLIDSWNTRSFNPETCPQIEQFSRRSARYLHHLSSSNGTRGGIFGWFFGITPSYWKYFENTNTRPLFIERLLQLDYDIQVFPSATLMNPPFYKVIFGNVKGLRTDTPGTTPFERDNRITADFLSYLEHYGQDSSSTRPFFAFLFYDLTHAIDLPSGYPRRFQPSWDYADYMKLDNDTDPTPFFNLYRNCAWHVDSLAGEVLQKLESKGLLDNTLVIISGDHSQEFNENHKNFWGHNGNFSDAQIHVPLLYYYPGVTPKTVTHRTTHYDIVPTLMQGWLGVENPLNDYSMGCLLDDTVRLPFHIAGSFDNYAILTDSVIYEKKLAGQLHVTDKRLNKYKGTPDVRLLQDAILYKNRFLKEK